MYLKLRSIAALAALLLATGCSIMHPVASDYDQYLANNKGASQFQTVKAGNQYQLPEATQNHKYEFRSALAGYANVWVVEFGKVLDTTMQSTDVINALGSMNKVSDGVPGAGNTLVFDLQSYTFEEHGAHIALTISIKDAKGELFKKAYRADGQTQGGKMFWAGAFGMKNAIQQSTKLALDEIIKNFILDLKAAPQMAAAK